MAVRRTLISPRLRRERRKKALIGAAIDVFLLASAVFLLVQILNISQISIANVYVEGNAVIPEEDLRGVAIEAISGRYALVFPKGNIFVFPRREIENKIRGGFKRVDNVEAEIENFESILITVSERKPFALWCRDALASDIGNDAGDQNGESRESGESESMSQEKIKRQECYFLDEGGFLFAAAPDFSGGVYVKHFGWLSEDNISEYDFPIGEIFLKPEKFKKLSGVVGSFSELGLVANEVHFIGDRLEVVVASGGRIIFNDSDEYIGVEENLRAVLSSEEFSVGEEGEFPEFEYIDLRFGNKVFFKPVEPAE